MIHQFRSHNLNIEPEYLEKYQDQKFKKHNKSSNTIFASVRDHLSKTFFITDSCQKLNPNQKIQHKLYILAGHPCSIKALLITVCKTVSGVLIIPPHRITLAIGKVALHLAISSSSSSVKLRPNKLDVGDVERNSLKLSSSSYFCLFNSLVRLKKKRPTFSSSLGMTILHPKVQTIGFLGVP
ncbi:hypothetical protein BpHYR1_050068 [Brachionus plicatilis]|uniref:Uncharacterized protein n=1 Tax=Brachionus plicatilis TaxID=10195 RepID=A0A3M7PNU1_BRAPC|nr:hypothetical protein BpHYR1_050068 [Brachionus plicatilis]